MGVKSRPILAIAVLGLWLGAGRAGSAGMPNPLNALPNMGYSVDGKPGPLIKQIEKQTEKRKLGVAGGGGALATDQGDFQEALLDMPATRARLEAIVARLEVNWPYAKPPQKLRVVMIGRPAEYSAEAVPDGSLLVDLGVIEKAKSDDEVACVLGHELTHVLLNHSDASAKIADHKRLIYGVARLYESAVYLSQERVQQSGGQMSIVGSDQKRVDSSSHKAAAQSERLRYVLEGIVGNAWVRAQEDEADAMAFDLVSRAGLSPETGCGAMFDNLIATEQARQALIAGLQDNLKTTAMKAMTTENVTAVLSGQGDAFLKKFKSDLMRGALDKATHWFETFMGQTHRNAAARKKGLLTYADAAYPDARMIKTSRAALDEIQALPEYKAAIVAATARDAASRLRAEEDLAGAQKEIAKALASPYRRTPFVMNEAARIERDLGRIDAANEDFDRVELGERSAAPVARAAPSGRRRSGGAAPAAQRQPSEQGRAPAQAQTLDGYTDHVDMLIKAARWSDAETVVDRAYRQTKDKTPFLPALIIVSIQNGHLQAALDFQQTCIATQDEALKTRCTLALADPANKKDVDKMTPEEQAKYNKEIGKQTAKSSVDFTSMFKAPAAQTPAK
jgi:hypothetical protein